MSNTRKLSFFSWRKFLEESPPGAFAMITDLTGGRGSRYELMTPDLQLHCANEHCDRRQFFGCITTTQYARAPAWGSFFFSYYCKNCNHTAKNFAVRLKADEDEQSGEAVKYGEIPPFGPVVPARVLRLIQPGKDLFLQGWRSEARGLGIGAFTYYRRVVEDQKDLIFDQTIKAAQSVGATDQQIKSLERDRENFQFTQSFDAIKSYIPDSLKINGQNPLLLLHAALSRGVHDLTDEQCLARAREARVVLTAFSQKLSEALREDAELKQAIGNLMKPAQTADTDAASE